MAEKYNKWQSRRWRITVWAMALVTGIIVYSLYSKYSPDWLNSVLSLLVAIPSVFIAGETYLKPKMNNFSNNSVEK